MPNFIIKTLGCKVNQFESEGISNYLIQNGWNLSETKPDVCIINTCTVTGNATNQSKSLINKIIKNHKASRVIVTGCYAQAESDEIKEISGVTDVIGHFDKQQIPDLILKSIEHTDITNDTENKFFKEMPAASYGSRTRPFLKIQDGCDSFCTYCIVPYARGRSRSMSFNKVIKTIKDYKQNGYLETVISGIHVGKYGYDLESKTNLTDLLETITDKRLIDRVRLGSIEPTEIDNRLLEIVKNSDIVCKHIHIPLQSGDSGILKQMGRPYDREFYKDLILKIKDLIPDISIGTDIMVGFPGESESEYQNSYDLINELPISYIHVFPFSKRKGTKAYDLEDNLSKNELKLRCDKLRSLGQDKKTDFIKNFSKRSMDVLIERKRNSKTGLLKGITSNYINIHFDGDDKYRNSIQRLNLAYNEKKMVMEGVLV
ncbi:MAG: tRNA (N(6)-L-threonylcarbamoyladenosine(37)-C(2))-methylthiotransferase MtaB [Desulfobacterales bacterium]|nr:tRNA (N(6)-L-threonylcarbamoyladenosine(37)-C(2))-methylthiotransferase MtaB [Desulfobacterales bacterium]